MIQYMKRPHAYSNDINKIRIAIAGKDAITCQAPI